MNFEFSEEQLMLREQARGFLSQESPPSVTRSVLDGDTHFDANLWQKVAEAPVFLRNGGRGPAHLGHFLPKSWVDQSRPSLFRLRCI